MVASLKANGVTFLVGGTGVGKSLIAKSISAGFLDGFTIANLRDAEANEVGDRLDVLLGRLGSIHVPGIILEDLNYLDLAGVILSLSESDNSTT